jgi:hypothetical protein
MEDVSLLQIFKVNLQINIIYVVSFKNSPYNNKKLRNPREGLWMAWSDLTLVPIQTRIT